MLDLADQFPDPLVVNFPPLEFFFLVFFLLILPEFIIRLIKILIILFIISLNINPQLPLSIRSNPRQIIFDHILIVEKRIKSA